MILAWDCYELGRLAYNTEDYYHTIMWMEEALAKIRQFHDEGVDENIVAILDYLAFAQYKVNIGARLLKLFRN
jgi:prolyl 4-hydroxylase